MLQKRILNFLENLQENNNREWFNAHKAEYKKLKKDFDLFIEMLINRISEFDPAVAGLSPKDCSFRIYRDIRFSKNKAPYKTNFGAFIVPKGKKSGLPGYYLHLEPGNSFIGGGVYHPDKDKLSAIREGIIKNQQEFESIIESEEFKGNFTLYDDKLKTAPRGYVKNHPAVEWLRYKSFAPFHPIPKKTVLSEDLFEYSIEVFKKLKPLNDFLMRFTQ